MSSRPLEQKLVLELSLRMVAAASFYHPRGGRCRREWWAHPREAQCLQPHGDPRGTRGSPHLRLKSWLCHIPAVQSYFIPLSLVLLVYKIQVITSINYFAQMAWHGISPPKVLADSMIVEKRCPHIDTAN